MFQVRVHGRGGQGVVTAAEVLSVAAFGDGYEAQAFPSFGSERMGAPVVAYCRIDDRVIRVREPVTEPDAVLVVDPTLLHHVDLFAGLSPKGYVLINSARSASDLGLDELTARLAPDRVVTVPGSELARQHTGRPLGNTPLLGAFAALTETISVDALGEALRRRFGATVGEKNATAARAGYDWVTERRKAVVRA